MKKVIAVALLVCLMAVLTACGGKPFTCDLCGLEKSGKKHTSEAYGTKMTICDDCYKDLQSIVAN